MKWIHSNINLSISCILLFLNSSFEVGVRVDAYAVGGEKRHIESAYFTFIAPDEMGNPVTVPILKPENEV